MATADTLITVFAPATRRCLVAGLRLACTYLLCLLCIPAAVAAEIAAVKAISHIGQPLQAEVELTALTPDELQSLQVKLALPDVYKLGNIRRNPVLNNVRLQLRLHDARPTLLMLSSQPVLESYLHVYLELNDSKGQSVRALTVWLEADPNRTTPIETENKTADLPHPDGDLSETAFVPPTSPIPATTPAAASTTPHAAPPHTLAASRAASPLAVPVATHNAKIRSRDSVNPASGTPFAAAAISRSGSCAVDLKKARQEALRCQLNEAENQRISGQLGLLETKVGILRKVILAEDYVPPVATIAPPAPIIAKPKKPELLPWKIILISAAVFVAVATIAFLLLMLRSKYLAKAGKTKKRIEPGNLPVAAAGESAAAEIAAGDAPPAAEEAAPAAAKPKNKLQALLAGTKARWQALRLAAKNRRAASMAKIGDKFAALKSKMKLPGKKKAVQDDKAEAADNVEASA